ncbi:hypothetical protein [Clostridium sp.]|uniref:hypothetical protein n=1 Tax=Clostridium sp. TaxID=1506 RepID=UPI00261B1275|nr:hypothetical protein [Clostridium sp.]
MAGYKPVTKNDSKIFLKLYKKYLLEKLENTYKEVEQSLEELPTDVIERSFDGVEFFKEGFDVSKIDDTMFGFGGLCGWNKVERVRQELGYYSRLQNEGTLVEQLEKFGHKVNFKKIGVRK